MVQARLNLTKNDHCGFEHQRRRVRGDWDHQKSVQVVLSHFETVRISSFTLLPSTQQIINQTKMLVNVTQRMGAREGFSGRVI
jgi:hypothetical protein